MGAQPQSAPSRFAAFEERKRARIAAKESEIEAAREEIPLERQKQRIGLVIGAITFRNWEERPVLRWLLVVAWPVLIMVGGGIVAGFLHAASGLATEAATPPAIFVAAFLIAPAGIFLFSLTRYYLASREERREEIESLHSRVRDLETELEALQRGDTAWAEVVLPDDVLDLLVSRVEMFNQNDPAAPRGLLLYGPPGTGKTVIAKKIASSTDSRFAAVSLPDLKSKYVGESAEKVRNLWREAQAHAKAVIFIDECEGAFGKRGSVDSDSTTAEIVQAFLAEWDGVGSSGRVWVIGATNRRDLIDPAILSRFGCEVEIPLPNRADRKKILDHELRKIGVPASFPESVLDNSSGMSGRDLATLARDAKAAAYPGSVTNEHFTKVLERMRGRGSTNVSADASWDRLVLDRKTKQQLQAACAMLRHAEKAKQQGISIPRGILLYGPPGTGKTQVARTIANESGLSFVAASTADLKAGFVGQSGQRVKELFDRARSSSPAIVFIDEMDVVAPARGGGSGTEDTFTKEIVAQLLQELDGVKAATADVFVLAATNRPEDIDSAILSRFPQKLEIPLPDEEGRKEILRVLLTGKPTAFALEDAWPTVRKITAGMSGRDLRNYVSAAEQRAFVRAIGSGTPDRVQISLDDLQGES